MNVAPSIRRWWWLSFCDPDRPSGQRFLGVVVIEASTFMEAIELSHSTQCNPGGEVQGLPLPEGLAIPPGFAGRLLPRQECEELDFLMEAQGNGPPA